MLVIRMQRTGRKGHAQFRVVVQDSRRTPTSGKIVASLGHFDPHTKQTSIDKEKTAFYLEHGAQPSDRVARLLKSEGIKLPNWVSLESKKKGSIRHPEKLRVNRPPEPAKPEVPAEPETSVSEAPTEEVAETLAEEPAIDAPAAEETVEITEEAAESTEEPVAESTEATAEETPSESEPETKE